MQLFDWLFKGRKPLSRMTRTELRRQELLIEKERANLLRRVEELAKAKQSIFDRGHAEKTPEVRKMLAQEFDVKTTEQLMVARQLNIRSKEMLTVTRLRMLRENLDRAQKVGSKLGMVSAQDIVALEKMIANDSITAELYQDRLDAILSAGVDEGQTGLSEAGQQVLEMWEHLDTGLIKDSKEAFEEADRRVRERHHASPEGA